MANFGDANITGSQDPKMQRKHNYLIELLNRAWQKVWTQDNDGPGSTLDADTLDTYHHTSFLKLVGGIMTGQLTITGNAADKPLQVRGINGITPTGDADDTLFLNLGTSKDVEIGAAGNTVWHKGNDGTGSLLDADKLDGNEATAFATAPVSNSFTPSIKFSGNAVDVTYTTQEGYYYIIGKLCFIHVNIVLSSKGTSVGNLEIADLPFANARTPEVVPCCIQKITYPASALELITRFNGAGRTYVNMFGQLSGAALSLVTNANVANDSVILLSGVYETT